MDYWLNQNGVNNVVDMIYKIMDIIRIVVPIGLIVMTSFDISKKVINPEDKDGQKKIMIRAIAALIVFLLPTILNIVLRVGGMDENGIDISSGKGNSITNNTYSPSINTEKANTELASISINNCPGGTRKFRKGESVTLNTNVPNTYNGSIKWEVFGGESFVNLRETNGGKSVQVNVLDVKFDTTSTIMVEAGGKKTSCKINVETDKLSSINIVNCPNERSYSLIGDRVELSTDIPSTFNGTVTWKVDDSSIAKIVDLSKKGKVTVELLARPKGGAAFITVVAGGSAKTCHINVKAVKNLEISSCPNNLVFNVGDKITLTSNLSANYLGPIEWAVSSYNKDEIRLTVSGTKREAVVEILKVPPLNQGTIILAADSETTHCKIRIE